MRPTRSGGAPLSGLFLVRRNWFAAGHAHSPSRDDSRRAPWSLALLFVVYALNIADRQIINILAQDIKQDFGLSDGELGLLTGMAFGIFYSFLGIPMGRLSDVVDRVRLTVIALSVWSGFTAMCGLAGSFTHLFLLRMGVGVGEACSVPASTSLVRDLYTEKRRTTAMSVLLIGAPVGSFLGLLVGGWVSSVWGWRMAFIVAGAPGLIVALIMAVSMRDPRRRASDHGRTTAFWPAIRTLLAQPRFGWVATGLACSGFFTIAVAAWLPAFFIRVHGLTTAETGLYTAISMGLGGVVGTLGGGLLCDHLRARIREVELTVLMWLAALSAISLLGIVLYPDRTVALSCTLIFNMCTFGLLGPIVILIQGEADVESRGLAVAVCMSFSNILNLGVALPLVGALSDLLTPAYGVHAIAYALALSGSLVAVFGLFVHRSARRLGPAGRSHVTIDAASMTMKSQG